MTRIVIPTSEARIWSAVPWHRFASHGDEGGGKPPHSKGWQPR